METRLPFQQQKCVNLKLLLQITYKPMNIVSGWKVITFPTTKSLHTKINFQLLER